MIAHARRDALGSGTILVVGLLVTAAFVGGLVFLWGTSTYDYWGAMVVGPVLFALTLPLLAREAREQGNPRMFWILVAALAAKLAFSMVRYYLAFEVYDKADAAAYHAAGSRMAARFREWDFAITTPTTAPGTRFIEISTAVLYTITGSTVLGGFLAYSWLAFLGLFAFFRAFRLAVPDGAVTGYACLLFFLPSFLYWPSSIGKEAWMTFTLGLAALGAARLFTGRAARGILLLVAGLWLATQVRPHYAGLLAIAVAVAYVFRRPSEQWRQIAPIAKAVSLVVLGLIAAFLVTRTQEFLGRESLGVDQIQSVLTETTEQTQQGGSRYEPIDLLSPLGVPIAVFTVLFRPLIIEANNANAAVAAVEGAFLLGLALLRWRWFLAALRAFRRRPYLVFAGAYALAGILVLSSLANFGILTRQRVLIFPMFLALLCVRPGTPASSGPGAEGDRRGIGAWAGGDGGGDPNGSPATPGPEGKEAHAVGSRAG